MGKNLTDVMKMGEPFAVRSLNLPLNTSMELSFQRLRLKCLGIQAYATFMMLNICNLFISFIIDAPLCHLSSNLKLI